MYPEGQVSQANPSIHRYFVIAAIAALIFAWLAVIVLQDTVPPFDTAVRDAIHAEDSPGLTFLMRSITLLGSGWFLWPAGTVIVYALVRSDRRREAALFAISVLGANLLDQGLKFTFHRTRPEAYFGEVQPSTYSFPSGHAFVSFCFYLTIAEVLTSPEWPRRVRVLVWACAIVITGLIGFSRVYLGVHYPTDVLAGYAGAISWLSLVRASHRLQRFTNS
jgi:undecaprenyl-diphosphatase